MTYEYVCESCKIVIEKDYAFGKAVKNIKCPECKKKCERNYSSANFILKGYGWPGKAKKMNKQQTALNAAAARRQKDNVPPVKTIAHDYGNGDVRETK